MHLPMRCLVSESQRGDMAAGVVSASEERWEVADSVRMEEGAMRACLNRRNALRGRELVVFMVHSISVFSSLEEEQIAK